MNVNEKKKGDVIVAVVAHSDVPRAVLVPTFTDNTSPLARNTIYSSTTTTVNNNVIVAAGPTATTSEVQVLLIDKNIVSYDKPSNLGFFGGIPQRPSLNTNSYSVQVGVGASIIPSTLATPTSRAYSLR